MHIASTAPEQPLSLSAIYQKRRSGSPIVVPTPLQPQPQEQPTAPAFEAPPRPTLRPATAPLRPAAPAPVSGPSADAFGSGSGTAISTPSPEAAAPEPAPHKAPLFTIPADPFRLIDITYRTLPFALLVGILVGVPLYLLARFTVDPHYIASTQLLRTDTPSTFRAAASGDAFKPTPITIPVLTNIMRSSALMERVAAATTPPISTPQLVAGLVISPERNSDLITTTWTSTHSREHAASILNTYTRELIEHTKQLQSRDAADINTFLKRELLRIEKDHLAVNDELLRYAKEAQIINADKEIDAFLNQLTTLNLKHETLKLDHDTLDLRITATQRELAKVSPLAGKLRQAQDELAALRLRYTDANPLVLEALEKEAQLRAQVTQARPDTNTPPLPGESSIGENLYLSLIDLRSQKEVLAQQIEQTDTARQKLRDQLQALPRKSMDYGLIKTRLDALVAARTILASRQREAQLFEENSLGACRLVAPARPEDTAIDTRHTKMLLAGGGGLGLGLFLTFAFAFWRNLASKPLLTAGDLQRITHLPTLAALPESLRGDKEGQARWAFRTWTRLLPQIHPPQTTTAFICGLLSDAPHPGQTHLINLLARAAVQRGSSVLLVTSTPPSDAPSLDLEEALACPPEDADSWLSAGTGVGYLVPGPGWTWTLDQQDQLLRALQHWQRHTSAIILVELPPASEPTTLRLAERLPKLVWLATSGHTPPSAITQHLTSYRHAGCQILGGIIHAVPTLRPALLNQLAGHAACFLLLLTALATQAEVSPQPAFAQPSPPQQKIPLNLPGEPIAHPTPQAPAPSPDDYRLGPGDSLNLQLYGHPQSARQNVRIIADGTLSYLQAQGIPATGLTLDELRLSLTAALTQHHRQPRLIITPNTLASQRVHILGKVVRKGSVILDRPLRILEAVALSGGLETGVFQQNTVELADLGRSFLKRGNERLPIDFERLFYQGDMTHNALLQNGDYLYFPSANSNEIYVLGEVSSPGTQGITSTTTITSAITSAGGFTARAHRTRILIIRGSLQNPTTLTCNMRDILSARAPSIRLEPKDIIFVSAHPWSRAQELLGLATTAFISGAVSGWTNTNIQPLLRASLLPSLPNAPAATNQPAP